MLKRSHTKHLDKKLKLRLRLYLLISLILIFVVSFEILTGKLLFWLAIFGLAIGLGVGVMAARMFLISWNKDAKKVISELDLLGGFILALYIGFVIFRSKIIGQFVQANFVTGTSLAVVAGVMIGRVFGTGRQISRILQQEDLI